MRIKVEFEGADKIQTFLNVFPKKSLKQIDRQLADWAKFLCAYLKENHPWVNRTGRLRRSHRWEKKGEAWYEISADPRREGAAKNYGMFLEYGTRKMPPYPWFRPAYFRFAKLIGQDVKKAVVRAARESR